MKISESHSYTGVIMKKGVKFAIFLILSWVVGMHSL